MERSGPFQRFSPEFELVVACCRPRDEPDWADTIAAAGQMKLDWQRLLRVATRHRVSALVYGALEDAQVSVPDTANQTLATSATNTGW